MFDFPGYVDCFNALQLVLCQFDWMDAYAGTSRLPTLNFDHTEVQGVLSLD